MIRGERRDGGEGEDRGLGKEEKRETKGNRVNNFEEEDKERHLPLLVV